MVEHTSKEGESNLKASPGSEPGLRKFTLSCSRCRASKLKCDKSEPCMECVKRNIGHLCTKDERQPRAKRAKTGHGNDNDNNNSNNTKTDALQNQELEAEETAKIIEHFVDGTSLTDVYPSALSFVTPDYPNTYWLDTKSPQRQGEKFALIREIVDSMPEVAILDLLYEVFLTRCQGPLGNIVHTPTFMKEVDTFCSCLALTSSEAQVMALYTTVSMDQLARHLLALVLGLAFHPTPSLLGWAPTPLTLRVEELRAPDVCSKTWRSLALRCIQGEVSLFCGSIASLQTAIMLLLNGQESSLTLDVILVTAISGAQNLGFHRLGDTELETSALPIPASQDGSSTWTEAPHIRIEIGIRIWWALVMRDWARGQNGIHPSQFNTRMPLHINDDDLCPTTLKVNAHGHIAERPRSEYTMLSYTVHTLEVVLFARELRGLSHQVHGAKETNEGAVMRNHLTKKYEDFVAGLPSYFRLGSNVGLTSTGPMAAIPVQRWMLHQQLWSICLKLHRGSLSSQSGRAFCQLLAQNIISTQAQIQARCAVCASLSTNETQLVNAAIVLLVDLLFASKHNDADLSSVQIRRLMTRDKIREAIELLRTPTGADAPPSPQNPQADRITASTQRSVIALEALMKLEEEESNDDQTTGGENSTGNRLGGQEQSSGNGARQPLKNRVMNIMMALQEDAQNAAAAVEQVGSNSFTDLDMSIPLSTVPDGFQDLDVLPVLSNDPNHNLWEFLNFTPPPQSPIENGIFPATADSQNVVGSSPSMMSPGMAHSLNSFVTQDFANMYGNTDGIDVAHTSPSSIESRPTD